MKKGAILAVFILTLMMSGKSYAGDVWEMANSPEYGQKAGGMLGRGLVNAATCFVDVIVQTVHGTQDGPPFVGTLTGLGSGIGCTALRATSGVLDVLTFWVPGFNGIPVSKDYANCLELEETTTDYAPSSGTYAAPVAADQQPAAHQRDASEYVKK